MFGKLFLSVATVGVLLLAEGGPISAQVTSVQNQATVRNQSTGRSQRDEQVRRFEAEVERLTRRHISLDVERDAIQREREQINRLRERASTSYDVTFGAIQRRTDALNRRIDRFNLDRIRFQDDVSDLKRRVLQFAQDRR